MWHTVCHILYDNNKTIAFKNNPHKDSIQYFGNAYERELDISETQKNYIGKIQQVMTNFIRNGDPNDNVKFYFLKNINMKIVFRVAVWLMFLSIKWFHSEIQEW